ncbi:MAG TPA: CHAT domain-containing protein [Myxococcota bacterium]|nr:CHAT domain-containing protein [Myxococcota bacterium]HRY94977.1 CHAT domain-containing protein [Myxococcota bacterium]HSA20968.1 CHAT domain-containing protein [Myxococcota bacterium]
MRTSILWLVTLLALPAVAEEAPQSVDPVELFRQGQQALADGDNPSALGIFRRVSALLPEDDGVLAALAQTLVNLGQLDEARDVYRRAARLAAGHGARDRLSIHHQSLVMLASQYPQELQAARAAASALPDTPPVQQALAEFGPLSQQVANLMAMGQLAEARPLVERALAVARRGFGRDHPSTLWALNSLADVRRVQGDARRALPLYGEAVKGCARRFGGQDFPDCLTYRNNQATCLRELGRLRPALEIMEAVYRASAKDLGGKHLLSLIYQGELGLQLSSAGQSLRGLHLLAEAIDGCAGALDGSNPHCLAMRAKLVTVAQRFGLYELAREQADRLLEDGRASLPEGHPLAIEVEKLRAGLSARSEDLDIQVEAYAADLKRARRRHRSGCGLLDATWKLAGAYHSQGRLEEALPLRREVLADLRRCLGQEHALVPRAESELAEVLLQLGQPFEAVPLLEHAHAALLAREGEADADTLSAAGSLGYAAFQAGQLDRARSVLERGLTLARERLGADHEASLLLLNNLGLVLNALGQSERARLLYAEAWEALRRLGKGEEEGGLRARHNLAQTLRELGLLSAAEVHERASLEGRTRRLGRAHPATLYSLHGLGLVLLERGHLAEARLSLEEALKLRRETLGERHPETLNSLAVLAQAAAAGGDPEGAVRSLRQASALTAEVLGPDHPRSLELQGQLAFFQVEADPAHDPAPLRAALARLSGVLGEASPTVLVWRFWEVIWRLGREDARAVEPALVAIHAGIGQAYDPGHPFRSQASVILGLVEFQLGKHAEARALMEEALPWLLATEGPDGRDALSARQVLAQLRGLAGDTGCWQDWRDIVRSRARRLEAQLWAADDRTRGVLLEAEGDPLRIMLSGLVALGSPEAARLALEVAFANKGLALRAAAEVAALSRAQADPALAGQARELAELRRELGERLAAGPRGEPLADFEARLEALRGGVREREVRLAASVVGLRQAAERPSFDAVAARLGKDEALVEYLVFRPLEAGARFGPERLAAAVLAPGASPETGLVDLGPLAEVSERTQVLRGLLGLPDLGAPATHLEDQARRLHALLWEPLAPWLRGRTRVWLVPEGPLNLLPFAALRGPGGRFLVQDVELGLLGSSRELLPRPPSAPAPAAGKALVLAGPDYGPAGPVEAAGASELAGLQFSALSGAADEGEQVAALLESGGRSVSLLRGAEASEGALRRARQPELVHLATHGFYLDSSGPARPSTSAGGELVAGLRGLTLAPRPAAPGAAAASAPPAGPRRDPLVRSGLALAAANEGVRGGHQADGNDGLLLALEALDLELQGCRLVVLSACETGLGDVRQGEGVQGLRRAFLEAGAQAVLSSLWQVSDQGTRAFMLRFYGHLLAGEPAPRALTLTQRELLGDADLSHPFFWAPFLVVGAGR